jgi:hypothetical protein
MNIQFAPTASIAVAVTCLAASAAGFANAAREGFVHVHRGSVGSAPGGPSVLDQANYRWLNPVARVTVTVR